MMSDALHRLTAALRERYAIEREIGRGGMATVYLARDLKHDRQVAIKVLRPDLGVMLGADRFLQEIRLTANLQHPHIVALYDSGEADGFLYYVMPFVEGESLRERLNREGKLPVREAARIAADAAAALDYAHRRDIVHRDIKPENILLHEGAVLVADFGIARATAAAGGSRLTAVGLAVGTPAYMSPEQAAGTADADARSDLYSLGCVLYEMLTGKPPFDAPTPQQVLSQQVVAEPPPLTASGIHVSGAVTGVVQRALAKEPGARYQTAREFSEAIDQAAVTGTAPVVGSGAWFVEQFLRPKVLGVLGGYLVLSVAAVAATKWLAGRLLLSSQLPWLVGVALLALLPAAGIVAWHFVGGRRESWGRVAGVGIPANLLAAGALLFLLFGSADLGSATTTVSVRNEMGDLINRAIPKSEYRRRVALFPVDNQSGDSALDWVQYAVPLAVSVDLGQDPFVRVLSPAEFRDQLEEAGKPDGLDLPLALKRRVASKVFMQYFTAGQITREAGQLVLTIGLYDTERASLIEQRTYQGDDVLGMVDAISVQLRHDLGIPSGALESTPDLPATELLTESRPAFRAYVDGMTAAALDRRFEDAGAALAVAVGADESFALANLARYGTLTQLGRSAEAEHALGQVMEHSYRLNERTQLQAKLVYYFLVQQDAEKAMAVATMWTELYPEDPDGHVQRAGLLELRNDLVGAVDEMQQVIALDSNQYDLLRTVGSLYAARGVFDTAVTYLEAYVEREPENPEGYLDLAGVALTQAAFDRAAELYDRALLLDAQNALALKGLGDAATGTGDFAGAARRYEEALAAARTAGQRSEVLSSMADLAVLRGRIGEALGSLRRYWAAQDEVGGPMQGDQMRLQSMHVLALGGMAEAALDSIRAIADRLGEAFGSLAAMGSLPVALEVDSVPLIAEAIEDTEVLITRFGLEALRPLVLRARARVLELGGHCPEALPLYEEAIPLAPTLRGFEIDIGRCLGVMGRFDEAEKRLRALTQKWPALPRADYELAVVLAARGDTTGARAELDRALEIWKDADAGFRPARKARDFARTLDGSDGP
jgi:tetratricopeptide (TPR) repeat protein/tRNA A-37 threonylcarbamoyl transferase component Bud32